MSGVKYLFTCVMHNESFYNGIMLFCFCSFHGMTVLVTFLTVVMLEGVAEIWPLSAGAKLKRRDRVLGKGEKK